MPHIHATSKEIIATCMSIFSQHRWNCSSLLFAPNFPTELRSGTIKNKRFIRYNHSFILTGTAEQAFVQALTSALLMA